RSRRSWAAIPSSRSCRSSGCGRRRSAPTRHHRRRAAPTCACRRSSTAPTASLPPQCCARKMRPRRAPLRRALKSPPKRPQVTKIRRATKSDAAEIGRVHVETWQSTYAGLLPDKTLAAMSDVRQSAWWSRVLADPREARGVFVADDEAMAGVGFGSGRPGRKPPGGVKERRRGGTRAQVGEVYTLYVESDFQNRGLGRRLLDALFRQLRSDGCDAVVLWMLADNPTRFFYEGMGGEIVGSRREAFAGTTVDE